MSAASEIEKILHDLHAAVLESSGRIGDLGLEVKQVEVTLKTTVEWKGGVEVDLKLIKIGGAGTDQTINTITVTFEPVGAIPAAPYASELAKALEVIERAIAAVGENMTLGSATVEVAFGVTAEGEINVIFAGSGKRNDTQTIKLKLGPA